MLLGRGTDEHQEALTQPHIDQLVHVLCLVAVLLHTSPTLVQLKAACLLSHCVVGADTDD
jgi:hypothetical protein